MPWEDWHFGTMKRGDVFAAGIAYGMFWQAKAHRQLVELIMPNFIIDKVRRVCERESIPAAFERAGPDHTTIILDYTKSP